MRERSNRVIRGLGLALAIGVVAAAVAVGGYRSSGGGSTTPVAAAPAAVPPAVGGEVGNAFVDKSPPPEAPGASGVDFRAFRHTTDQAIGLFQTRVDRNPRDFVSWTLLGDAHALKARESSDPGHLAQAEDALRKSLAILPDYTRAKTSLALVLCDRHKFAEAFELAAKVYDENPGNRNALTTMADAELELGWYVEAEGNYQKLLGQLEEPSALARMARLTELKGQTDEALGLLRRAAAIERKAGGAADAAWYDVRVGEICFDAGRLDEAEQAYRAVLKEVPAQPVAMANLGQILGCRGRYGEAIALVQKSLASVVDLSALAVLGELYVKSGQESQARAALDRFEQKALRYPEYRRELSLFYSRRDRAPGRALELARQEVAARPDVFSYDALAWALYKDGRAGEAAKAITEALKLGTQDASFFYHAGMIYQRLGDRASARTWLGRALARNPHFSLLDAEEARRTLAVLE